MHVRKNRKLPSIQSPIRYLKSHIRLISLCLVVLAIFLGIIFVPPLLTVSDLVSPQEFITYIEEYLSEYTKLVNENYALLVFPESYLNNFTLFLHPPNEIEGIISRTHGAAIFFNTSGIGKEAKIIIKEISEPVEYYVWPQMPKNTSLLPWVLVKAGHYHLDSPVTYDYGLFYLEPGVIMRYTGEGEGLRISGLGAITVFGSVIYEDRMVLKGSNSKEDWSKIQARFDALSDFIWDCREALNETKIEETNVRYKFFLLLDKIAFRMESDRYRDDPDLFRVDYEELEKVCTSNATLSKVLNDYLEMQENPPPTLSERILDFLFPEIVAPVAVIVISAIMWTTYRWINRPKIVIGFDNRNSNHLGIFRYYRIGINRMHARIFVSNKGRSKAKSVMGLVEILDPQLQSEQIYLHWADTPFSDPTPSAVDIPKDGFKILDVVFSQPSDQELYEDLGSDQFSLGTTTVLEHIPTPSTLPPEAIRDISQYLENSAGMATAEPSGCYIATNLALWSPKGFPQYHLSPREFNIVVSLIGDNIRKARITFKLVSPEDWRDLRLEIDHSTNIH